MAYESDLMDKEQSLITSELAKGKTILEIPKWFVGTLNCKEIQWRFANDSEACLMRESSVFFIKKSNKKKYPS